MERIIIIIIKVECFNIYYNFYNIQLYYIVWKVKLRF